MADGVVKPDKRSFVFKPAQPMRLIRKSYTSIIKIGSSLSNNYCWLLPLALITISVCASLIYQDVESYQHPIYQNVDDVPRMPVAIVFGAGIGTPVFKDRVKTAVALYKSGKVMKLLMTGDNRTLNYNEPAAMKAEAMKAGVKDQDIACDYAGFRTYDSLYRARDIFEVDRAVLVTQRYHLPRAMFIAQHLGLTVVGLDAALRPYGTAQCWFDLREIAAVETAWLDVMSGRKPKYLGKKEPLFPQTKA